MRIDEIIAAADKLNTLGVRSMVDVFGEWTPEEWAAIQQLATRSRVQCWLTRGADGKNVTDETRVLRGQVEVVFFRFRYPTEAEVAAHLENHAIPADPWARSCAQEV